MKSRLNNITGIYRFGQDFDHVEGITRLPKPFDIAFVERVAGFSSVIVCLRTCWNCYFLVFDLSSGTPTVAITAVARITTTAMLM